MKIGIYCPWMSLRILLILWSLIMAFTPVIVQSSPANECPTVEVRGPSGTEDGPHIKFEAIVSGPRSTKIRYEWLVSKGQIIEGRGTRKITVLQDDREGGVTATVNVAGLPKGCPSTVSETTAPLDPPHAVLIDEFEGPIERLPEETLRVAANEQKQNPNHLLFIIAYFEKNDSLFDAREAIRKASEFLIKEMKLDAKDIEIVIEQTDARSVKIYRLPPGAAKPTP